MGATCTVLSNTSALVTVHREHRSPSKLIYSLLDAAAHGDVSLMETTLSMGAKVDDCDHSGRTALHLACAEGQVEMVQYLLKIGAALDVQDKCGREPLHEAVQNGHANIVSVLEEAGAVLSAEARAEYEEKMRRYAHEGNLTGLRCLVRGGISPLPEDYLGLSAFQIAADSGNNELVEYLLTTGLDLNRNVHMGNSIARTKGHIRHDRPNHLSITKAPRTDWRNKGNYEASFAIMQSCPEPIASAMLQGRDIEPLYRASASLFFSDIVGFTTISSNMPPVRVSSMLNALFKRLDRLAHLHGVQKIDVVGDAYIAATNFTEDQPHDHAARLARFALDAAAAAATVPVDPDAPAAHGCLQIRVGMHCGPVTGIVAERGAYKYTLLGDTARVAARMESGGAPGMVQCSAASARLIEEQADDFMLRPRTGGVALAAADGAGPVPSFWVSRKRHGWRRFKSCKEFLTGGVGAGRGVADASAWPGSTSQLDGLSLFWAPAGGSAGVGAAAAAAAMRAASERALAPSISPPERRRSCE